MEQGVLGPCVDCGPPKARHKRGTRLRREYIPEYVGWPSTVQACPVDSKAGDFLTWRRRGSFESFGISPRRPTGLNLGARVIPSLAGQPLAPFSSQSILSQSSALLA